MSEQELKSKIIEKAWSDPEFKEKLIADPKSTLKDSFGIDIPEEINVKVVEENQDDYYLVIPQSPSSSNSDVEAPRWP